MDSFLSAFVGASAAFLSIFASLFIAYHIYLVQKRDDLVLSIRQKLRELNQGVWTLCRLHDQRYGHSDEMSITGTLLALLNKESWTDSPATLFEPIVKEIEAEYRKAQERDRDPNPARSALYLPVSFGLNQLASLMVAEFPAPPGNYSWPKRFESFIDPDFPTSYERFAVWLSRFRRYGDEVYRVVMRLSRILEHMQRIHRDQAEQRARLEKQLPPDFGTPSVKDSLRWVSENATRESQYYSAFFRLIPALVERGDQITDEKRTYDRYSINVRSVVSVLVALSGMAVTGFLLPLDYLLPQGLQWAASANSTVPLLPPARVLPALFSVFLVLGTALVVWDIFDRN